MPGVLPARIVLGSRSPRRHELLLELVGERGIDIEVLPPSSVEETGFAGVSDWPGIRQRLTEIARAKGVDVRLQLGVQRRATGMAAIVCADTVIVAGEPGEAPRVLEQPPLENWKQTVRDWFLRYYLGRTHTAATSICLVTGAGRVLSRVVESQVTFRAGMESELDWYLATGESVGKAGGYAVQGEARVFIDRIEGSLSNVIGLPLEALAEMFVELGIDVG